MTRITQVVLTCDRCGFGVEQPATQIRSFSLEDLHYRLDLCERHADQFDRELAGWSRLATEQERPHHRRSEYFTEQRRAEARRITELRAKATTQAESLRFAEQRIAEIEAENEAERLEKQAPSSIPGASNWNLTAHAIERMAVRGFTVGQVLWAAAQPSLVRASQRDPNLALHQRDGCCVVVDPRIRNIVTVIDADPDPDSSTPTERTAP